MKTIGIPLACCLLLILLGGVGCNGARQDRGQSRQGGSIATAESPKKQSDPVLFFGAKMKSAERVVFVVDRSGSMVSHFDDVRLELLQSVGRLKPVQQFHIVLFAAGDPIESPPGRLVNATGAAKRAFPRFLESDRIQPSGKTVVLPALKRAFEVLAPGPTVDGPRGGAICLVTDGVFGGIGGGSTYKGFSGSEAVIQWLGDNNRSGAIRVCTYLYGNDPEAVKVMKQIAKDNGGRFKQIADE